MTIHSLHGAPPETTRKAIRICGHFIEPEEVDRQMRNADESWRRMYEAGERSRAAMSAEDRKSDALDTASDVDGLLSHFESGEDDETL